MKCDYCQKDDLSYFTDLHLTWELDTSVPFERKRLICLTCIYAGKYPEKGN